MLRAVEGGSPLIVEQRVVGLRTVLAVDGELDRRLAVICPPGNVRRVLQVARVDGALPLYHDVVASNHDA